MQDLRNHNIIATSAVGTGVVTPELLAALRKGDLVVLTTRERGGLARWALGSVADELVRRAPGPVMLVRAAGGDSTRRRRRDAAAAPSIAPMLAGMSENAS